MPAETTASSIRPKLAAAQAALEAALQEACEVDVAHADSADLLRLEETLTLARESTKHTIQLLQRLNTEQPRVAQAEAPESHRLFVDDRGVQWDAFCVYPSQTSSGRRALPTPYHEGWLSIQCDNEIRRLTPIPEGWSDLPRSALCELLAKASSAPRRRRT